MNLLNVSQKSNTRVTTNLRNNIIRIQLQCKSCAVICKIEDVILRSIDDLCALELSTGDQTESWGFTPHTWSVPHKPVNSMWLSSTHLEALTKVNVVISSSLAVHLVDKEAGHRLEQQAEDGHPRAEAKHVPPRLCGEVIYRVIDPKMDDVGQYRHDHPHQKLRGETTAVTLLNFNCTCPRGKVLFTLLKYQNIW